jgi:hypothetical protein
VKRNRRAIAAAFLFAATREWRKDKKELPGSLVKGGRRSGKDVAHYYSCFWTGYGYGLREGKGVFPLAGE